MRLIIENVDEETVEALRALARATASTEGAIVDIALVIAAEEIRARYADFKGGGLVKTTE